VVEGFTTLFCGGDSDEKVLFNLALPDEVRHTSRAQAGIQRAVFYCWLPGHYTRDGFVSFPSNVIARPDIIGTRQSLGVG
jgi:hypothetical protein